MMFIVSHCMPATGYGIVSQADTCQEIRSGIYEKDRVLLNNEYIILSKYFR